MRAARSAQRPFILVLAGADGAGKSSVAGALLREHGLTWFNPDSYARELMARSGLDQAEANVRAWAHGRDRLETAIAGGTNHAFETTLGARTIPELLIEAARSHDLLMLFCGLASADLYVRWVRARVARGGHDIPESKIRERWTSSLANLVELLPYLKRLQVFDNSVEVAPGDDIPDPVLVLEMIDGRVIVPESRSVGALVAVPEWARGVVEAALESLP